MKDYPKRPVVALGECAAILVGMPLFYILSYPIFNQEFPRWK